MILKDKLHIILVDSLECFFLWVLVLSNIFMASYTVQKLLLKCHEKWMLYIRPDCYWYNEAGKRSYIRMLDELWRLQVTSKPKLSIYKQIRTYRQRLYMCPNLKLNERAPYV